MKKAIIVAVIVIAVFTLGIRAVNSVRDREYQSEMAKWERIERDARR